MSEVQGGSKGTAAALDEVIKSFQGQEVLRGLTFSVSKGEILALLGPSGCGKTTTLFLAAGLEHPDRGRIVLDERVVSGPGVWVPPHRRGVGMVFQDQALWPHLTVREHLAFVLKARGKAGADGRIRACLEGLGLGGKEDRYPSQLSGGEAQRLGLARALAVQPTLLLLDEPCAHLDGRLRDSFLDLLSNFRAQEAFSAGIYVTHEAGEAFRLADRIAVMDQGRVGQTGRPEEVLADPATPRIASLLGQGFLAEGPLAPDGRLALGGNLLEIRPPASPLAPGQILLAYLRPADLVLDPSGPLRGQVAAQYFDGTEWRVTWEADGYRFPARSPAKTILGETVPVRLLRPVKVWKNVVKDTLQAPLGGP